MKQQISKLSSLRTAVFFGTLTLLLGAMLIQSVQSMSLDQTSMDLSGKSQPVSLTLIENPELVARVLDSLLRSILYSSSVDLQTSQVATQKRGLDLGISRGFSGSQAGKHLMGLSAASFANGPGRR